MRPQRAGRASPEVPRRTSPTTTAEPLASVRGRERESAVVSALDDVRAWEARGRRSADDRPSVVAPHAPPIHRGPEHPPLPPHRLPPLPPPPLPAPHPLP